MSTVQLPSFHKSVFDLLRSFLRDCWLYLKLWPCGAWILSAQKAGWKNTTLSHFWSQIKDSLTWLPRLQLVQLTNSQSPLTMLFISRQTACAYSYHIASKAPIGIWFDPSYHRQSLIYWLLRYTLMQFTSWNADSYPFTYYKNSLRVFIGLGREI